MKGPQSLLTINGGSSSIRFGVYEASDPPRRKLAGKIERIGSNGTTLTVTGAAGTAQRARQLPRAGRRNAVAFLLDWLEAQAILPSVDAVGHRVVCATRHAESVRITPRLVAELRGVALYDADHLPHEIALIEGISRRRPKLPQVACFDTAFHRTMPRVARMLPIPRRYIAKGIERYGFHGLSYTYLMEELGRLDPLGARGRVILAHLGSGASLAAVRNGQSVDTSMGFTPASGLMMGNRSGDLDPGLGYYLSRTERMTAAGFQRMVTHESGLLGVSGTSSDLRDLLAREARDTRAADAIALFCYQAKKWVGSFAAVLGGIDTLVFAGGIGEHAPEIRARICDDLGFLGVKLDARRNRRNAPIISSAAACTKVRVIQTDEDLMIARSVARVVKLRSS